MALVVFRFAHFVHFYSIPNATAPHTIYQMNSLGVCKENSENSVQYIKNVGMCKAVLNIGIGPKKIKYGFSYSSYAYRQFLV